jgi:stage II sporulation protein P
MTKEKRRASVSIKPLLAAICVVSAVWALTGINSVPGFMTALSLELREDAAVAILRAETSADTLRAPTLASLLSLGSPLLRSLRPPEGMEGNHIAARHPHPSPGIFSRESPPVMIPMLPRGREPHPEPSPAEGPDVSGDGLTLWDDRVWTQPDENDPDARPLREVTLLPIAPDGGYLIDGTVAVNNETAFSLDIPAMLSQSLKLKASGEPQILIIHTHGSESFLPDERDFYIPTDIERTEDTRYNIVRVGDEIAARLEQDFGLNVIHDRNINDFPTYSGSYARTLRAIEGYKKKYPSIQVVLDIHRDSITSRDGTKFKTVCDTSYGKTAQMMFVVGTNGTGLPHPGWRDNMAFAVHLQSRLLEACPTLMRPIHLRRERFNQHAAPGSLILEVGTAANTLTEALRAANLFCDAAGPYLAELLLPG